MRALSPWRVAGNGNIRQRLFEFLPQRRQVLAYGVQRAGVGQLFDPVAALRQRGGAQEGGRARLGNISDRSFNIEVFSYINVKEFDTQVIIREELLLNIYEQLEAGGIELAFPTQTVVYLSKQPEEDDQSPAPVVIYP